MRRYHSASEEEDKPMFPPDDREWEHFVKSDGSLMTAEEADLHYNWSDDDYEYDADDDDWEYEYYPQEEYEPDMEE